ncbi:hypothetical protein F7725_020258, partial [Dissostichus mawsoni]
MRDKTLALQRLRRAVPLPREGTTVFAARTPRSSGPVKSGRSCTSVATHLNEYDEEGLSHASRPSSCPSARGSSEGADDGSMGAVIRMALARQQLDVRQPETAPATVGLATGGPDPLLSDCIEPVRRTILNARAPSTRRQYEN